MSHPVRIAHHRATLRTLAAAWSLACFVTSPACSQRPIPNTQHPTPSSSSTANTGIVHSQKLASGVPLGGIGAGTFQMLTDGTVSGATLANNWSHPGGDAPGCFGAVWAQANGRSTARVLTLNDAYHLPTIAKLDYDGLFPQARLTFSDPALPVSISLLAFSPLVPFDLKNSSFPGAAMVMRVKNPSTAVMEVSVALSWESLLSNPGAAGGQAAIIPSGEGFFGARFSGSDPDTEMTLLAYPARAQAIVTTGLWNAGDAQPAWWSQFSQDGSIPPSAPGMTLRAARPAGVVAVRLTLKPGETTEIPFAACWYLKHLRTPTGEDVGHYYEIAFTSAQDAARQLLEDWRSLYGLTEEWQKRLTFSNLPGWQARRLINSAAPLTTNTVHTRDGRFAFVGTIGNMAPKQAQARTTNSGIPSTNTPSNASAGERANERDETRAHQTAQTLLLALFPQLAAQELEQFAATQDSRGWAVPPADADWSRRLGPPNPPRAPLVPNTDTLLSALAPEKPNTAPAGAASSGKQPRSSRPNGTAVAPKSQVTAPPLAPSAPLPSPALSSLDATAAYVLQWTQFTLWTGDTDFLKLHYPTLRLALRALLHAKDEGGRRKEEANSDSSFLLPPSSFTLWLAALRGGEMLARMGGENALALECETAFKAGSARLEARHWNGEFYAENVPVESLSERKHVVLPADLCASDQLWGQWLAYELELGLLLPPAHLSRAAQSLQQRNNSPTLATLLPPWQIRADGTFPADAAARECLLSASLLADAALNIWLDQPEVGVSLLSRLDEARNTILRSPWQYPARVGIRDKGKGISEGTGNPSTLSVASDWNVLYALQGFALDINAGRMTLAPNIPGTWRSFTAPVFAPTFWGRMEYRPSAHGGVTTFRLDRLIGFITSPALQSLRNRAELTLKTLRVQGPPRRENNALPATFTAHISIGTKPIGSRSVLDKDGLVTLTFDSPLTLTAGDRLEVDIH